MIEIESLAFGGMAVPLKCVKELLCTAINDRKLPELFVMSSRQAEWIALIIDQLLARSYIAAAMSLSYEFQHFATGQHHLPTPGMNLCDPTTQVLNSRIVDAFPSGKTLQRRRLTNSLWTVQTFSKSTSLGAIKAEIYLIGDRLYSEILCFRVRYAPNRQLLDTGAAVDYVSQHITSLVRLVRQPSPELGLPTCSLFPDLESLFDLAVEKYSSPICGMNALRFLLDFGSHLEFSYSFISSGHTSKEGDMSDPKFSWLVDLVS